MEMRTSAYLNLRVFPTGRALFALHLTHKAAERSGDTALVARVDRAIAAAGRARQLERQWAAQQAHGTGGAGVEVTRADNALDGELAAFDRVLAAEANRWKRRDPDKSARVAAARQVLFPQGIGKVISAIHEEGLAAVHDLLALSDPNGAGHDAAVTQVIDELGLTPDLAEVARLADDLRLAMNRETPDRLAFKAVQAARNELQDNLSAVVVYVLATSDTEDGDPQTAARRGELLSGILTQDEEIRSYRVRSPLVPDIDPATGLETHDPAPAESPGAPSDP